MYRTFVIIRHTFLEAVVQPIYTLMVALGAAILGLFGLLPFFTLGEDAVMYIAVGLDVILLFVLIATLFATSRSIYEEIEDRTMLTLMSKPVSRWQVMAGKYLGIILSALLAIVILGTIICLCVWRRIPNDYMISSMTLDDRVLRDLYEHRAMHLAGLIPSLLLVWLQISVLASIGVALSTRVPLVVNLPVVILLYIAGNLSRFLFPLTDRSLVVKVLGYVMATLLPYLEIFDLRPLTVYAPIGLADTQYAANPRSVDPVLIWQYLGFAMVYAVVYVTLVLSAGMLLFRSRELGGAEG